MRLGGSICTLLALVLAAPVAAADATIVMLVAADQEDENVVVGRAVTSQMSDIDAEFLLETVSRHPDGLKAQVDAAQEIGRARDAVAVFWFEPVSDDTVYLYLIQRVADRILVRDVTEAEQWGRAEALAVIVRLSVREILRGGTIGIAVAEAVDEPEPREPPTAPPAPTAAPPPAPAPAPDEHHQGFATVAYAFHAHSEPHPAVHGAHLEVGWRPHRSWAVLAGYTFVAPLRAEGVIADLRLDRHPLRLGVRGDFALGRVRLGGSLSMLVDYATFEVSQLEDGIASVDDRSDVVVSLIPCLEFGVRVADWFVVIMSAGVEIAMNPLIYETGGPLGEEELLDPWPVQPWVLAGASFEFL